MKKQLVRLVTKCGTMKRLVSLSLAAIMALTLTACGGAGEPETSAALPSQREAASEKTVPEPVQENEGESNSETTGKMSAGEEDTPEAAVTEATVSLEKFDVTPAIEETVLAEEQNVKISATELDYGAYAVELRLALENSGEKALTFTIEAISVNGYMLEHVSLYREVSAGRKANETVDISLDVLAQNGIAQIAEIQILFDLYDEDYEHISILSEPVRTSAFDGYDDSVNYYGDSLQNGSYEAALDCTVSFYSEEILYAQREVEIVSSALIAGNDGWIKLQVELENQSDQILYAKFGSIAVNGLVLSGSSWSSVCMMPRKSCIAKLNLTNIFPEALWSLYGLADIGALTYSISLLNDEYNTIEENARVGFSLPGHEASFDSSGVEVCVEDPVRVVFKDIVANEEAYGVNMCSVLLLVENTSDQAIQIELEYDSLAVNGYMTDYFAYGKSLAAGESAVLEVELWKDDMAENGLDAVEEITEVEFTLIVRKPDSYVSLAEPTITIQY